MSEKRKFSRIPFRQALGLEIKQFECFEGTVAFDLSESGIRVRINQFVPVGSAIRVKFQVEGGVFITLAGKVVWVQKEPYGDHYQIGMQFQEESTEIFKKKIRDYIEQQYSL